MAALSEIPRRLRRFRPSRAPRHRLRRATVTAALVIAGVTGGAAVAGPVLASPTPPPAPRAATSSPARPNDATPAHTGYLKQHAAADHMGGSLRYHWAAAPPRPAAVPLLPQAAAAAAQVLGLDVSSWQGNVNWAQVAASGAQFAYVKATEGTYYTNPYFSQQYNGSHNAGLYRGAYAFAIPSYSSGASQADYLAAHGGGWSAGTKTLPAALDVEYNPYGPSCYGLSKSAMVSWISAFLWEYHARTGRWAVIYTTTDWWSTCTGNYGGFANGSPLWIARYASRMGTLPAGWPWNTFWQYADAGPFPGDQDVFNGSSARLQALANNTA